MKKTILTLILTAALAISAYSQQYDSENDFAVQREGNRITIAKYTGVKQEVRIPPSIQDLPVTTIGGYAFRDCTSLAAVTIPDSVTSIGYNTFYGCTSLTSVTFQGAIASSGFHNDAFDGLGDLRTKFYMADSTNGMPGTYTRANGGSVWTRR
jgi:hypothetical protein